MSSHKKAVLHSNRNIIHYVVDGLDEHSPLRMEIARALKENPNLTLAELVEINRESIEIDQLTNSACREVYN